MLDISKKQNQYFGISFTKDANSLTHVIEEPAI